MGDFVKPKRAFRSAKKNQAHRKLPRLDPFGEHGRQHRGDFLPAKTRSAVMARIRGTNTGPERAVAAMLRSLGMNTEGHARDLPGRPDFVIRERKIAIFVDGDFWHGWRFPEWRLKLSEAWEAKIQVNRRRDKRNHARLRRAGWTVLRIWEHQVANNPERVVARISALITAKRA